METNNFKAMVATASSKYTKLVESIYNAKGMTEEDLNKILSLVHSVYLDEMDLITLLNGVVIERDRVTEKKVELKLFDFMVKR